MYKKICILEWLQGIRRLQQPLGLIGLRFRDLGFGLGVYVLSFLSELVLELGQDRFKM